MKKLYMLPALLLAVSLLLSGAALAENPDASCAITVQGNASVSAQPDIVTITANADVTGNTMLSAQEQVSSVIAGASEKLIAERSVSLKNLTEELEEYEKNYAPAVVLFNQRVSDAHRRSKSAISKKILSGLGTCSYQPIVFPR